MKRALQLAWVAGIVDGEGCVSLTRRQPQHGAISPSYRMVLKVTMCDRRTVYRVRHIMGVGTIQRQRSKSINWSDAWVWFCNAADTQRALVQLLPYLVTKGAQARVALKFLRLALGRRGGFGGSPTLSQAMLERRARYHAVLRDAKRKGRRTK